MKLNVNGKEREVPEGLTLAELAEILQTPAQGVAVAVENQLVPRARWTETHLKENDRIVVIKAACGG